MVVLQTAKTTQETAMNHGTKTIELPELTANLLRNTSQPTDFKKRN